METNWMDRTEKLLQELTEASIANGNQIPALVFRAHHVDDFDELEQLERAGYLVRRENIYSLTLLALRGQRARFPEIESLVYLCEHIFSKLQSQYLSQPGEVMPWTKFLEIVDMPEHQVYRAVQIMEDLQFWGTRPTREPDGNTMIGADESILTYESLDGVLDQLEEWRSSQNVLDGIGITTGPTNYIVATTNEAKQKMYDARIAIAELTARYDNYAFDDDEMDEDLWAILSHLDACVAMLARHQLNKSLANDTQSLWAKYKGADKVLSASIKEAVNIVKELLAHFMT